MSDWINVDDRLPGYDVQVIVATPNTKGTKWEVCAGYFNCTDVDGYHFCERLDDPSSSEITDVRYWMPLPKAPRGKP